MGTTRPAGEPVVVACALMALDITASAGEGPDEVVLVLQGVTTQEQMDALGLGWEDVVEPQTFAKVRVTFAEPAPPLLLPEDTPEG